MNMNEQEWNEIWDEEPDEDNEFNDFGSDVDANNDETFDNAAEWNEDEHEELIARDSILSHNTRRAQPTGRNTGERILTVDELEKQLLRTSLNSDSNNREQTTPTMNRHVELNKRAGWSPFGGKEIFNSPDTQTHSQLGMGSQNILAPGHLPNSLVLEQQRQLFMHQQQQQMLQQQQLLQQMALMKQQQIQAEQRLMAQNPQCFTLEEIERQILAERSTQNQGNTHVQPTPERLNLNDKERRDHQPREDQRDLQLRGDQRDSKHREDQRELQHRENQRDLQHRENHRDHHHRENNRDHPLRENNRDQPLRENNRDHPLRENNRDHPLRESNRDHAPRENHRDHALRENHRDHHHHRENQRDHHHRDNQRDHRHKSNRARGPIIVPPQVQLSVIEKGKNLHPLASTQGDDEYLQDRVPTMKDGFLMKRHSTVSKNKPSHDGVLTEKEKKWLIQMQEKILADYDVNYLSSYNRYLRIYFPNLGTKCEK